MTEPAWVKWWQRRCPAVAVVGVGNYPHCDLRLGHGGNHCAERGMYNEVWSENFVL